MAEDGLITARGGRAPVHLVAIGADSFAPEADPAARFSFVFDASARAGALRVAQSDGSASVLKRDAAPSAP